MAYEVGSFFYLNGIKHKVYKVLSPNTVCAEWKDKRGKHSGLFLDGHHDIIDIDLGEKKRGKNFSSNFKHDY